MPWKALRFYYEKQLAARGVQPPFSTSWGSCRNGAENDPQPPAKELPRAFHNALLG